MSQIGLLSLKPKIIVCNVDEENFNKGNEHTKKLKKYPNEKIITICADIEDQLSSLNLEDKSKFMREIGLEKMGISNYQRRVRPAKSRNFFTSGEEESRA